LERIDLSAYDIGSWVEQVVVGGESGYYARSCDFDWVMELLDLCVEQNVSFWFKQTGAKFVKDGKLYEINRQLQHAQARKAGINYTRKKIER
jgi:protein gp37